jgi:hypothetical protein
MYTATINVPGYLPMDDDPPIFETAAEAWWYLYHERCYGESDYPCRVCVEETGEDCGEQSETADELSKRAKWAESGLVCDFETQGTVYGDTPGYDGDHDLGLAYSVTLVEEA